MAGVLEEVVPLLRERRWRRGSLSSEPQGSSMGVLLSLGLVLMPFGLAPATAMGQESILALEFSFSDPGARSLGLAGSFAGLADDATAAFANPAGLVQLSRPEVSVEGRRWSFATPYTKGGRITGEPTGLGIDTSTGLRIGESSEDVAGLSFLSFVYPRGRWSLAVYRHELANFESRSATNGLFFGVADRFADQRAALDLEITSYGLAVAYRVTEDFSLGLGVALHDGSLRSQTEVFDIDAPTLEAHFGRNSYLPERLVLVEGFELDGEDWQASAGFLWHFASRFSFGGFVRPGPTFVMRSTARSGPLLDLPIGTVLVSAEDVVPIPDVFGAGLAFRSTSGRLTLACEWDRVQYSDLLVGLRRRVEAMGEQMPVEVEDGDEFHVGAEYAFLGSRPIVAPRFGVWLDPDHRLAATGRDDPVENALRRPGDDELHYAMGVGIAFERFQIDLAGDLSEAVDTVSISVIYGF